MRQISREMVLEKIREMQKAGNHVDGRLIDEVKALKMVFFLLILEDKESFLSLIWHKIDASRLLTLPNSSRTLRDIAQRMIDQSLTFEVLATDLGLPSSQHDPGWFKKCVDIDAEFDYDRFGWIIVVPATDHEHNQSPYGTFYIRDGCHKTLVLSKRLLCNETRFQPIESLLLVPRPK
jgi:hypothetical protein